MQPKLVGILESRESLASKILEAVEWVSERCFYCHNCRECYITSAVQKEVNREGFKTFNKHVTWWSIIWIKDLPVLKPEC